jgi:hypothetical protein
MIPEQVPCLLQAIEKQGVVLHFEKFSILPANWAAFIQTYSVFTSHSLFKGRIVA